MRSTLEIYLRNHEAAAGAGRDLFRRVAANQSRRPYADALAELTVEVEEDLRRLRTLMARIGIGTDPVLGLAMRAGERLARLKPNGHLLRPAPLSDLIEVEGLLDAVHAKWAGWRALSATGPGADDPRLDAPELAELERRAEQQVDRLISIHAEVSARVLGPA